MAIRTKEYCDICELIHGEESEKALIVKPPKKPAFPQLIWTYYKKGKRILQKPTGEPVLVDDWVGHPNRLEFCDDHAQDFNVLLKALVYGDYDLDEILDKLKEKDRREWALKKQDKTDEHASLHKKWSKDASDGD